MIDRITNDDNDRGQVGIGTLIVFIAMVLVAAIAAGVLINTAGFLQSSAEESGEQSSAQVTNRLQVVNAVGSDITTDEAGSEVTTVELTVKKAPGADNVDLTTTTAQMVSSDGTFDIVSYQATQEGGGTTGDGTFATSTFQDDDNSITNSNVLNDPADRAKMKFQTDSVTAAGAGDSEVTAISASLFEGSTASIKLNTQAGGETTATLVVPESLSGKSAVSL